MKPILVLVLALAIVPLVVAAPALAKPANPFSCLPEDTTVCDLYDDPVGGLGDALDPCSRGWC